MVKLATNNAVMLNEIVKLFGMTELYNDMAQLIGKKVKTFTPQLYYDDHSNGEIPPSAFASSILIKTANNFFLVTAAHVFHEEEIKNIGFFINRYFYVISGELNYHEPNDGIYYDARNLDIAVFKLDYVSVDLLKNYYSFLELQDLEFNHFSSVASRYLVFGYPEQITVNNDSTKTVIPASMSLRTIGVDQSYYEKDITRDRTIILSGKQTNMHPANSNSLDKVTVFSGISGCGVWNVTKLSKENPEYKLVSILTGEDEDKTVFYSTKIDVIISILNLNKWL